ncbi:transmembrane protein, putative, partial (macronuclear) [Tetrahymena thermophila SB210]
FYFRYIQIYSKSKQIIITDQFQRNISFITKLLLEMFLKGILKPNFNNKGQNFTKSFLHLNQYNFSRSLNLNLLSDVVSSSEFIGKFKGEDKLKDIKELTYIDRDISLNGKKIMATIKNPVFYDFTAKNIYSPDTKVSYLFQSDFFVASQDDGKIIAILKNDPLDKSKEYSYDQYLLNEVCKGFNLNPQEQHILSDYVTRFSEQLTQSVYKQVDRDFISLVNQKVLTELSLNQKYKEEIYNIIYNTLNKKLQRQLQKQKELFEVIDKKSNKYMKRIFYISASKILALQYCTYVLLSWDIMEPITCLFGIFDIGLAYFFWLVTHKDFDYLNLRERYIQKKQNSIENYLQQEYIDDLQSLVNYVNQLKTMDSPNLQEILNQL